MIVLVAAATFPSEMSGVQRHAFNLVRCLLLSGRIAAVHLVVAPWQRKLVTSAGLLASGRLHIHFAEMESSPVSRNIWYYRGLPSLAASLQVDLVHLAFPAPVNAGALPCPVVVTLHDLYPYEIPLNFGLPQILFNRLILQQCLRNVNAIVCVSQTTRDLLRKHAPERVWNKAVRIYNCVEPMRESHPHSPIPGWEGEPFLLSVAQHRRNKNIPLLLRAFSRLLRLRRIEPNMRLVVIGIGGPETPRILSLISRLGLRGKVCLLEGISEAQLKWCYSRCEALVAPSKTEGFGLPVAEALLAGCRVVCSDIPAFREIAAQHCRFVSLDRNEVEDLADAIAAALREPARIPLTLPQFSSHAISGQLISLYRTLLASPTPLPIAASSDPVRTAPAERRLQWK